MSYICFHINKIKEKMYYSYLQKTNFELNLNHADLGSYKSSIACVQFRIFWNMFEFPEWGQDSKAAETPATSEMKWLF